MGEPTDLEVKHTQKVLRVARNLWIVPRGSGRFWVFRYQIDGKNREMGLGSYLYVSLKEAREEADKQRRLLKRGIDPLEHRRELELQERSRGATFSHVAAAFIREHRHSLSRKQALDWARTLRRYARPILGELPIGAIDTESVLRVLMPMWNVKPILAKRIQSRLERILDYAKAKGLREGDNPAAWKGHLANVLPKPSRLHRTKHHAAMDYAEVPGFLLELRSRPDLAARALEFLVLCAARVTEVRLARWDEVDLGAKTWTVPAERMKTRRPHRIPLSTSAWDMLKALPQVDEYVFPGSGRSGAVGKSTLYRLLPEDCTLHGFRSSFRDWVAEQTGFPERIAEHALAHTVGDATERSYRRTDLFERRRELMQAWSEFLAPTKNKIIAIRR